LLYSFEDFSLDTARRELRRSAALVARQPQVFDLLEYLIRNRERVVSTDDLLAAVWNGRIVSESTLSTRINAARRALCDSGEEQRLIRTAHGKGIRFVGEVREGAETVRKLAAIFAADVAGYSQLMGQDEVGTLRRLTTVAPFSTSTSQPEGLLPWAFAGRETEYLYLDGAAFEGAGENVRAHRRHRDFVGARRIPEMAPIDYRIRFDPLCLIDGHAGHTSSLVDDNRSH
jgi:DNA-binding winged helix-turn-helix (wHTH) protein